MSAREVFTVVVRGDPYFDGLSRDEIGDLFDKAAAALTAAGFTIVKCGMVDALRTARCPSDGRHLVGECYDAKACGCTIGLHLAAANNDR